MKTVLLNVWVFPRNLPISFVLFWRRFISPIYGDVCRYQPTCSAYGLGSLQQHGVVFGSALTIWRIFRCNPWSKGGLDPVIEGPKWLSVTKQGFVVVKSSKGSKKEGK